MSDEAEWSCLACTMSNKSCYSECPTCKTPRGSKEAPPKTLEDQQFSSGIAKSQDSPAAAGAFHRTSTKCVNSVTEASDSSEEDSEQAGASFTNSPTARPDISQRRDSPGDSHWHVQEPKAGSILPGIEPSLGEPGPQVTDEDGMSQLDHRLIQVWDPSVVHPEQPALQSRPLSGPELESGTPGSRKLHAARA